MLCLDVCVSWSGGDDELRSEGVRWYPLEGANLAAAAKEEAASRHDRSTLTAPAGPGSVPDADETPPARPPRRPHAKSSQMVARLRPMTDGPAPRRRSTV